MEHTSMVPPAASPASTNTPSATPLSFEEGMRQAYQLYRKGWKPLVVMLVLGVALAAASVATLMAASGVGSWLGKSPVLGTATFRVLAVLVTIAAVLGQFWISVAYLKLISSGGTVRENLESSKPLIWPFIVTSILSGLVVFGGGILIVPAIIWSVSFAVLPWVIICEGLRGHAALLKARRLVYGDGWWLFLMQLGALLLTVILPGLLERQVARLGEDNLIGMLLSGGISIFQSFVLGPIVTIFGYLLYRDLVSRKGARLPDLPETPGRFKVACWIGVVVLAFATYAFVRSRM